MNNPRLATRYAKSIFDLAVEKKQLEVVHKDMKLILSICETNPDFVTLLRSPIIKPTVKGKIIESVTKARVSVLTTSFIKLLVTKTRELNLPEIAEAFVDQYNLVKNIHVVRITTAVPLSEPFKADVLSRLEKNTPVGTVELVTKVNEKLIGGFIMETEGKLIDTTIMKDLNQIKNQFLKNDYLYKLR